MAAALSVPGRPIRKCSFAPNNVGACTLVNLHGDKYRGLQRDMDQSRQPRRQEAEALRTFASRVAAVGDYVPNPAWRAELKRRLLNAMSQAQPS